MSGTIPPQGTLPTDGGVWGQAGRHDADSYFNALSFLINQIIAGNAFSGLVQVKSVAGGGTGKPPMVSVQPMVNQVDGLGNQVPHGTIYNIPCFRLQGGNGAVILDPVVGDIGMAVICDRDISAVKNTGAVSPPGSRRTNSWADGCYFGGFLNAAPTTFIQIVGGNIIITAPGTVTLNGNLHVTGAVIAGFGGADQIGLQTHSHDAPPDGGATSAPIAGT